MPTSNLARRAFLRSGAALLAAQECGVRHYYLEEEAVEAEPQIRQSLRYLQELR